MMSNVIEPQEFTPEQEASVRVESLARIAEMKRGR